MVKKNTIILIFKDHQRSIQQESGCQSFGDFGCVRKYMEVRQLERNETLANTFIRINFNVSLGNGSLGRYYQTVMSRVAHFFKQK